LCVFLWCVLFFVVKEGWRAIQNVVAPFCGEVKTQKDRKVSVLNCSEYYFWRMMLLVLYEKLILFFLKIVFHKLSVGVLIQCTLDLIYSNNLAKFLFKPPFCMCIIRLLNTWKVSFVLFTFSCLVINCQTLLLNVGLTVLYVYVKYINVTCLDDIYVKVIRAKVLSQKMSIFS